MTTAYPHGLRSSRNHFVEPESVPERVVHGLSSSLSLTLRKLYAVVGSTANSVTRKSSNRKTPSRWSIRRILSVPNVLIVLWMLTIWWGERLVFRHSLEMCAWDTWEEWPRESTPHHVIFIADPQLVDPHTYPGRPWPLSSLTVYYTDVYLRRTYSLLQQTLHPDTLFFLGDLFDGGREWATANTVSPEDRYKGYDTNFWLREYNRFGKMFFCHWNDGGSEPGPGQQGRKIFAGLPGNHDLGFGVGVHGEVKKRFNAYFGDGNQVNIVGNHSFVSVDTVSLSAMDQADPVTGSSGTGAGDGENPNGQIWKTVEDFLDGVKDQKARAVATELRYMNGQSESDLFPYNVTNLDEATGPEKLPLSQSTGFPTILLTHVPLYRAPGTPCGPLREHWPPPTHSRSPDLDPNNPNAIPVHGGYQYQNVLTPTVSIDLVTKVGPDIAHVYSGDDHDYCEIEHMEFSSAVKEITVKSMSWAMGVRKPGFLMTSLWNPVDLSTGQPVSSTSSSSATLQNHLCLLPDQLGIFIQYGFLLTFSILVLLIRALAIASSTTPDHCSSSSSSSSKPLLPLSQFPNNKHTDEKSSSYPRSPSPNTSTSSSSSTSSSDRLNARAPSASRSNNGGDHFGPARHAHTAVENDGWEDARYSTSSKSRTQTVPVVIRVIGEFSASIVRVAGVVVVFYLWVLWNG